MAQPSLGPSGFQNEETNLGGADAVPDTPDVIGGKRHRAVSVETSADRSGVGKSAPMGVVAWVLMLAIVIAMFVYGYGFIHH